MSTRNIFFGMVLDPAHCLTSIKPFSKKNPKAQSTALFLLNTSTITPTSNWEAYPNKFRLAGWNQSAHSVLLLILTWTISNVPIWTWSPCVRPPLALSWNVSSLQAGEIRSCARLYHSLFFAKQAEASKRRRKEDFQDNAPALRPSSHTINPDVMHSIEAPSHSQSKRKMHIALPDFSLRAGIVYRFTFS